MIEQVAYWAVPAVLTAVGWLFCRKKGGEAATDAFLAGCEEGLRAAWRLLPTLIMLVTGVSMFAASGCGEWVTRICGGALERIGMPSELLPFLLLRPASGGGSMAMLQQIVSEHGGDSFIGRCAAVMMGSSDTVLYIVAVYFLAAKMKRTGYAMPAALLTMVFSAFLCCAVCRLFFT